MKKDIEEKHKEYKIIKSSIKTYFDKISDEKFIKGQEYQISKTLNRFDILSKEINQILIKYKDNKNLGTYYSKLEQEFNNNKSQYEEMSIKIQEQFQSKGVNILDEEEIKKIDNYQRKDSLMQSVQIGKGKLIDRQKMLDQRDKDLKEAQIVAAEIKDAAVNINVNLQKQGEALEVVNDNADDASNNIDKAFNDIKDIKGMQVNRGKKICNLWLLIIFVVLSLFGVLIALFWEKIKGIFSN